MLPKGAPLDSTLAEIALPTVAANEPTDEALMVAYADGDSQALATLYDRFGDPLYRFCLQCVGNIDLAQDLVQDIFVSLAKSRSRYQPTSAFRHYIFHMARNRVITHWRRERPTTSINEVENFLPDSGNNPALEIENADMNRAIDRAIADLPEDQKLVVLLRLNGDLSMDEIADIQGVGMETAKNRYRLAIAKLRKALVHD